MIKLGTNVECVIARPRGGGRVVSGTVVEVIEPNKLPSPGLYESIIGQRNRSFKRSPYTRYAVQAQDGSVYFPRHPKSVRQVAPAADKFSLENYTSQQLEEAAGIKPKAAGKKQPILSRQEAIELRAQLKRWVAVLDERLDC